MKIIHETKLMFVRSMQHTLRNPIWVFLSLFQPLLYLLLFMPLLNGFAAVILLAILTFWWAMKSLEKMAD